LEELKNPPLEKGIDCSLTLERILEVTPLERGVGRLSDNVILSPSTRPVDELRSSRSGQAPRRISRFFVALLLRMTSKNTVSRWTVVI
jgi:hypothetical protein